MFAVRYFALIALAIWVGGMVAPFWLDAGLARIQPPPRYLAYPCGAAVLVSLFVLKFVGPPPPAFPFRAGLVVVMLAIVAWADAMSMTSVIPTAVNVVVGLVLMSWYARE